MPLTKSPKVHPDIRSRQRSSFEPGQFRAHTNCHRALGRNVTAGSRRQCSKTVVLYFCAPASCSPRLHPPVPTGAVKYGQNNPQGAPCTAWRGPPSGSGSTTKTKRPLRVHVINTARSHSVSVKRCDVHNSRREPARLTQHAAAFSHKRLVPICVSQNKRPRYRFPSARVWRRKPRRFTLYSIRKRAHRRCSRPMASRSSTFDFVALAKESSRSPERLIPTGPTET